MFQSILPVLLLLAREPTTLTLGGRTDEPHSPAAYYMRYIILPFLSKHFGINCQLDIMTRSCSDQSDGEIVAITPVDRKLRCISLLEKELPFYHGPYMDYQTRVQIVTECISDHQQSS
jgi:RNA 3'-terminal phosphate cyclase